MGQAYQISKSDIPPPAPKNPRSKTCSQATANSQCSQVMSQCSQKTADMQIDEAIIRSDSETEQNDAAKSIVEEIKQKKNKKEKKVHKNYGFSESSESSKPSSGYKRIKSTEKDLE